VKLQQLQIASRSTDFKKRQLNQIVELDLIWPKLKSAYTVNFKEMEYGDFPDEKELLATLNRIKNSISGVEWKLKAF
jgi:hypothetical protein